MASKTPTATLIQVPARFSIVEPGVYRCASPTGPQVPFLQSLGLRTIVSLTPEHPTRQLVVYMRASGVDFVHMGSTLFQPQTDWRPVTDEIVKTALELILDVRSHPVLVIDPLGIHQTGVVFGCLRMLQRWNFASALSEYRTHSGPTKHRYSDETYIELFDPDLINLPPNHCLPAWWIEDDDVIDEWVETDPPPKEKKKKKKDKEGKEGKEGKDKEGKEGKEGKEDKEGKEGKEDKEGKDKRDKETGQKETESEGKGDNGGEPNEPPATGPAANGALHADSAYPHGADGGVG